MPSVCLSVWGQQARYWPTSAPVDAQDVRLLGVKFYLIQEDEDYLRCEYGHIKEAHLWPIHKVELSISSYNKPAPLYRPPSRRLKPTRDKWAA